MVAFFFEYMLFLFNITLNDELLKEVIKSLDNVSTYCSNSSSVLFFILVTINGSSNLIKLPSLVVIILVPSSVRLALSDSNWPVLTNWTAISFALTELVDKISNNWVGAILAVILSLVLYTIFLFVELLM